MALEDLFFGKNVALGDGRRPGPRRRDARRRRARACPASTTRRRRSRWPSAAPARPARSRSSSMVGSLLGAARAARVRPRRRRARGRDLPRGGAGTRGRSRPRRAAPTRPPRRPGAARSPDDRLGQRRGAGPPARPRRHRRRRRRLPARGLRGDPEGGPGDRASEAILHAQLSPATTRSRSTASPPRRSATSSCS